MIWIAYVVILLVVMQRLGELVLANRNTQKLKAKGAIEIGAGHYPLIVFLHGAWLIATLWLLPAHPVISWPWLAVFVLLEIARVCVIASLGPYWTTRIISLPGAPLVKRGPYRFVRHPNYLVVAGEILALPMVFGEWGVAIVFTIANALILYWRIRMEDTALQARRQGS
jgi:methyltransferase